MHILLVEADPHIRETIKEMLNTLEHTVTDAGNCESALAHFAAGGHDVVVSDLRMTEGDVGRRMVQAIRQNSSNVPFILLSAYNNIRTIQDARWADADDLLPCPVTADRLQHAIKRTLRQH